MRLTLKQETELAHLFKRAQDGDKESYQRALEISSFFLQSFIASRLRKLNLAFDLQQDLAQEVLVALHTKLHTYNPEKPILPWLMTIAKFKIVDRIRSEKFDVYLTQSEFDNFEAEEIELSTPDLEVMLSTLSKRDHQLLVLTKIEGVSVREAAKTLKLTESNAKVIIHRAVKQLRKFYLRGQK